MKQSGHVAAMQWVRLFVILAGLGLVAWASSRVGHVEQGLPLWPAGPLVAALLARPDFAPTKRLGVGALLVFVVAQMAAGQSGAVALGWALTDLGTALLFVGATRRWSPDLESPRGLVTLLAISAALSLLAGTVTSLIVAHASPLEILVWITAWFLGLLSLTLPTLAYDARMDAALYRLIPIAFVIAGSAALTWLVFVHADQPMAFLLVPAGVFSALRLGLAGATFSTITVAAVATLATIAGRGPIARIYADPIDQVFGLQMVLITFALTAFPIALLLRSRRRALATAKDMESRLRLITENTTEMISTIGPDLMRRWASAAATRLLGFPSDQLVGRSVPELVHPDDEAAYRHAVSTTFVTGTGSVAYRHMHVNGAFVWLEASLRRVQTEKDVEIVAVNRDITARRAAEAEAARARELIAERERLLSMAETLAGVGYWRVQAGSNEITWSPEIFRIHGLEPGVTPSLDEAISAVHPDDREAVRAAMAQTLELGVVYALTVRIRRPDGELRWARSVAQRDVIDGVTTGIFGVIQDVTEETRRLQELTRAREAAEQALVVRTAFTATVNHEIRTPLTSMLAAIELLSHASDAERDEYLDIVQRGGQLLAALVDNVLLLSRLEDGGAEMQPEIFDVSTLIADVAALISPEIRSRGLLFEVECQDDDAVVSGYATQLARVLTNLLGNAAKFTSEGRITLSAVPSGNDLWRFTVADTGLGIAPNRHQAIFEPYVQESRDVARDHGGTGLGLTISKHLVERMGGRISVVSETGFGSVFSIEIPLPRSSGRPLADSPIAVANRRQHILLAEDNATNRLLTAALLRRAGHDVAVAAGGVAAVEMFDHEHIDAFDCILMDVRMPRVDGFTAARAIRCLSDAGARVPIYALTADLSLVADPTAGGDVFDEVISKPIDTAELERALGRVSEVAESNARQRRFGDFVHIERDKIALLRSHLTANEFRNLVHQVRRDAERLPRRIRAAARKKQTGEAALLTHEFRGAIAMLGCEAIIDILAQIDASLSSGADMSLLDRLDRQAAALALACRSLAQLRPQSPSIAILKASTA